MPLESKAQMRRMQEMVKQGKMKQDVLDKWIAETPNIESLPERKIAPTGIDRIKAIRNTKVIK